MQWSAKGLDGTAIGLLWAIGVVAEILLFAASHRVLAYMLQCLHGLAFGATHLGAMHVLGRLAERTSGAVAQGDFSAVQALTFAAAMGLSGALVEALGSSAYLAMSVAAASGFVIVFAGRRIWLAVDPA